MSFREEEIVALKTQLESISERVQVYQESITNRSDARLDGENLKNTLNFHLDRYRKFKEDYNNFIEQRNLKEFSKMDDFDEFEEETTAGIARGRLSDLKRNLKTASRVLETIENKEVGTEKVVQLTSIKDSIDGTLTEKQPILSNNLKKAIDAVEDGHPKPASITAAGVVEHVMDELKSELRVGDWEEAVTELEEKDIIDEETDGRIHRALKESRNELSHDLETDPDINNSIHTISGAVRLLEQVSEIDDLEIQV